MAPTARTIPFEFHKLSGDHLHREIDDGIASVRAALAISAYNAHTLQPSNEMNILLAVSRAARL